MVKDDVTIMREKISIAIAALWVLALFVYSFLAYMVRSSNEDGPCDGLGRHLSDAPLLMRIFFGQDHSWAGFGWFAVDMIAFWGSIAIAVVLVLRKH